MKNLKIVTSGDKNYFKFLWRFEQNIHKQYGEYPIIYDLGLTESQKDKLKSKIIKINVPSGFSEYTSEGFIKAIHKPLCILDFFTNNSSNCLFLDADILFSREINSKDFMFVNFDMGVTPRHPVERYDELYKNGFINSGVLYFANNLKMKDFINRWVEECNHENISDQLALSNLISNTEDVFFKQKKVDVKGVKVKFLDPLLYNDVSLTKGVILHYKNAARNDKAFRRYINEFFIIQNSLPLRKLYILHIKLKRLLHRLTEYFYKK